MDMDFMRELIGDFVIEANEHFEVIESSVLELEKNPMDQKHIRNIFRAYHTIKGNASLLKLESITALSHKAENMLSKIRDEERPADNHTIDVILEVTDILKNLIGCVEKGESIDYDLTNILDRIEQEVNKQLPSEGPTPPAAPSSSPLPAPAVQEPQALTQSISREEYSAPISAAVSSGPCPAAHQPVSFETWEEIKKKSVGQLHLTIRRKNNVYIFIVRGKVDAPGVDTLLKELINVSDQGHNKVILDLEMAHALSFLGLGALYATHEQFKRKHGALRLLKIDPISSRTLKVIGKENLLDIYYSLEEALMGF